MSTPSEQFQDPEPYIQLQPAEDKGAAACGCELIRCYDVCGDYSDDPAMFLCPLHAAAPDLLAALRDLLQDVEEYGLRDHAGCAINDPPSEIAARAAIAKAEGKS